MVGLDRLVLGHLTGDYLLQSKQMAIMKSQPGMKGFLWCLSHSLLYTGAVCLFAWTVDPLFVLLIFLSHFPLDRWSFGAWWLKLIHGRDFLAEYKSEDPYREIHLSFACLVYAVVDNTLHLIPMWFIGQYL